MTTQTPTSDGAAALAPSSPPASLLPDEATLNRLAGEFFARLPGLAPAVDKSPSLGGSGSVLDAAPRYANRPPPQPGPAFAAIAPGVATAQVPPVTPPLESPIAPAPASVPTPRLSAINAPGAPSPYYFIGGAHGYPASGHGLDGLARQGRGQHDADDLRGLSATPQRAPARQLPVPPSNSQPEFYFQTVLPAQPAGATPGEHQAPAPFDVHAVRRDFPVLAERVNGKPLAWFDNAATTHKPQSVIDRIAYFYAHENSNIHRAAHALAARASDAYEAARAKVAGFLGAASANEIIFVRGATEGINLVANTFGRKYIGSGDEIIVSQLEHHANIVPWQQLAAEKGATLRVIPVDDSGQIILDEFRKLLNGRTKLVSMTQVSNALGTVTPVAQIIALAHAAGVRVLVDGAQAVSHLRVDVQALGADFYVFSGHKVFAPTGIGAVYGKADLLEQLPPWQGGGNMIADVTFERTVYQGVPNRFEAGTGNIADAVGLGAAIDYVQRIGLENIAAYEHALLDYATHRLQAIAGVRLIGTALDKASVASFVLAGYEPAEVGRALNDEGIAVRSGHHCAQPILRRFGVEATVRPSFAFYNTYEEIDRMIAVVRRLAGARR
ncbi:family 2A encapsulin nanocompartment cargo protein cysteine desulfurase [Janthinobacterium sp. 1_2014MBL_MicDiv]|uniref:family 2A encapsulin nanocompartment cargo protein cysteine desulfurase n=1 Tax=Janthinobacterium sp. 1_2014MBL_MicDiv TaxID=1644131 RepID=UPI0008F4AADE|nr:family 2A encapsulin nanocompartment cargo protein cysteine desulfurase [Janthinobacterium sp. 1_2014MBL_MicDiv]APA70380.1 cysteine desulfurase [Janthinobacterium sp. 1_2014MBL_MicDiv]